ncbi:MAG: NUDIX domain-containing protein [Pseudomonadota bacterium]
MTDSFRIVGSLAAAGPAAVAAVAFRDGEGRLLLQLRDAFPDVVYGGYWGLFGGAVDAGETVLAAAVRETEEELGLALPPTAFCPVAQTVSTLPDRARLHFFRVDVVIAPSDIRLGEGAGFAFFTLDQVRALRLVPTLRRVLEADVGL